MWGIILGILTFIILVILHEFGHFTAAKKSGVKVKEFGLGLPPKILTFWKDKSGTEYTLNRIPLGGFVSLKGEDGTDNEEINDKDSFVKAKLWKKLIIVLAGVAMNFITAWVLFTIAFSVGMQPMSILPDGYMGLYSESYVTPSRSFLEKEGLLTEDLHEETVYVKQFIEGTPADELGFKRGTKIVSINGEPVTTDNLATILSGLAETDANEIIYMHKDDSSEYKGTFSCEEECLLGIIYENYRTPTIKFSFGKSMIVALKEIKAEWCLTMSNLKRIGTQLTQGEAKEALNSLSGPVAIVKVGQVLFENFGFLSFLGFAGLISVALAIMNILPIPALDGGRFWALIIQKVFRIKEEKFSKVEGRVNMFFLILLLLIGIVIIIKDLTYRGVNIPFFS